MSNKNQRVLKQWIQDTESNGKCVKHGDYEDGIFSDSGTMIDSEINNFDPTEIIEVTPDYLQYYDNGTNCKFYADSFPVDEFGQTAIFRDTPDCYWWYIDKNASDAPAFLSELDQESIDELLEEPDLLTDWANWKYPNSFSYVGEIIDSESSEWFWDCYTYNPELSEQEVLDIMREYLETFQVNN